MTKLPEPFEHARHYWRTRDLPMLLGDVSGVVVEKIGAKMQERRAVERRWSVADEG